MQTYPNVCQRGVLRNGSLGRWGSEHGPDGLWLTYFEVSDLRVEFEHFQNKNCECILAIETPNGNSSKKN